MLLLILQPDLLKRFMSTSDSAALFRQILTKLQTLKSHLQNVSYLKTTCYLFHISLIEYFLTCIDLIQKSVSSTLKSSPKNKYNVYKRMLLISS